MQADPSPMLRGLVARSDDAGRGDAFELGYRNHRCLRDICAAARLEGASASITVPNVTGAASALRGLVSCRVGNTGS